MQPKLDDIGGARELAMHRLTVAKDDLAAAEQSFEESITGHQITAPTMQFPARFLPVWP